MSELPATSTDRSEAPPRTVLIVDDDRLLSRAVSEYLDARGLRVEAAPTVAEARARLPQGAVDIVLLDEQLPDGRGHELCGTILEHHPRAKILFATAFPSFEHALLAIRAGAYDYLQKPFELEALWLAIRRALRLTELERVERLQSYQPPGGGSETPLAGRSPGMAEIRRLVDLVAGAAAPVLVTGETGTGKSLIAKAIHQAGPRKSGPFVSLSCAALPESLIEAELFGWERGAFTGAIGAREGLFELAEGGTLFLDEIGELPLHLQPKLLAVLEERAVRRLGGRASRPVEVRLVAATNVELETAVQEKRFRADLFYRLNVVRFRMPPLRERPEDLPELCASLLRQLCQSEGRCGLDESELRRLATYDWPGNVRELRNVLERSVLLHKDALRPSEFLPAGEPAATVARRDSEPGTLHTLAQVEQEHIVRALEACRGNLTRTASVLGISLSTLKRRVHDLQLTVTHSE